MVMLPAKHLIETLRGIHFFLYKSPCGYYIFHLSLSHIVISIHTFYAKTIYIYILLVKMLK